MRLLLATALILTLATAPGCGDSHDDLAKETISATKEMITVLESMKDEASAKAAKPKLNAVMERIEKLDARGAKMMGEMNEAQVDSMDAKYSKEMETVQMKLMQEMMRVGMDPAIAPVLHDMDMNSQGK